MHYRRLGRTALDVSLIGLGTMTWGEQNSEAEAQAQLDCALDHGVNFIDTAEMYPVPPSAPTQGLTERYLGNWLAARGVRSRVVVATKVSGPGHEHIRGGARLQREQVIAACEGSLRRLQTDYIDVYQVHWPDRPVNSFGRLFYADDEAVADAVPIEETLSALDVLVKAGKVRHVGISNETPWGLAEYLRLHRERGLPRVQSIQNPYSLLNRSFEVGLSEFAAREDCGLLAYSPLAFGMLSGKHAQGPAPGSRLARYARFKRYSSEQAQAATAAYVGLARDHGLSPAQMALAFVNSRPFVTSTIIGATQLEQLKQNLGSIDMRLSAELLQGIERIHQRYTIPCP